MVAPRVGFRATRSSSAVEIVLTIASGISASDASIGGVVPASRAGSNPPNRSVIAGLASRGPTLGSPHRPETLGQLKDRSLVALIGDDVPAARVRVR